MNKDSDRNKDSGYHSQSLRERITRGIKSTRDKTEEVKKPQVKYLPVIPVTGDEENHKYLQNKSFTKR